MMATISREDVEPLRGKRVRVISADGTVTDGIYFYWERAMSAEEPAAMILSPLSGEKYEIFCPTAEIESVIPLEA